MQIIENERVPQLLSGPYEGFPQMDSRNLLSGSVLDQAHHYPPQHETSLHLGSLSLSPFSPPLSLSTPPAISLHLALSFPEFPEALASLSVSPSPPDLIFQLSFAIILFTPSSASLLSFTLPSFHSLFFYLLLYLFIFCFLSIYFFFFLYV